MARKRQAKEHAVGIDGLIEQGFINENESPMLLRDIAQRYTVRVPTSLLRQMDKNKKGTEALRRQYIPSTLERIICADESADPTGDMRHSPMTGVVHRYRDRVLLKPTAVCPVYCRFCFRRDSVGRAGKPMTQQDLQKAYRYLREHKDVCEVIITGGDPLMLAQKRLQDIMAQLEAIEHIGILRVHSRVIVVAPERVTPSFLAFLSRLRNAWYFVIHCNHAIELTDEVRRLCRQLMRSGVMLLGQSVLLRGVNDNQDALIMLWRAMLQAHIKPYALHHLDYACGTSHFRVGLQRGLTLFSAACRSLSGLCVPRFMVEIPHGGGKMALQELCHKKDGDGWLLRDEKGVWHPYRE